MIKKTLTRIFWILTNTILIAIFCIVLFLAAMALQAPNIKQLQDVHFQKPLRVFTQDNKLMAEFGDIKRIPVTLNQVPDLLIKATLATEDKRFYSHGGVDFFGLLRAAKVLFATGKKEEGGSTITMQVARNFFLTRQKTYTRKIKEILLAIRIDDELGKDKILELYFNKVFYGNRAYGIAAAAQVYYGKHLNELTVDEMAMLAGIPQSPSHVNPITNLPAAEKRRNHVLTRMRELNYINEETYRTAIDAPITARRHELAITVKADHVAELARQFAVKLLGESAYTEGYDIYTTIDSKMQISSNNAVEEAVLAYDRRHGYRGPVESIGEVDITNLTPIINKLQKLPTIANLKPAMVIDVYEHSASILLPNNEIKKITFAGVTWARSQIVTNDEESFSDYPGKISDVLQSGDIIYVLPKGEDDFRLSQLPQIEIALVALDPENGALLAMNGGVNFYHNKFNHATQAKRQPGSSFKPFIYSAALTQKYTLASIFDDSPMAIPDENSEDALWQPENDKNIYGGPMRLRAALATSRNIVAIRVLQQIGIPYAVKYLQKFGFRPSQLPPSLSLALGTATVTPVRMAAAYATFANGGYRIKPFFITKITGQNGVNAYQYDEDKFKQKVISATNAYLITSVLKDVVRMHAPADVLTRNDLAGKTGTTNKKRDAWFCGYNAKLVVSVWMGFDDFRPVFEYATTTTFPLWLDFMQQALAGRPDANLPMPAGIVSVRIDRTTGLRAKANDKNSMYEFFTKSTVPK